MYNFKYRLILCSFETWDILQTCFGQAELRRKSISNLFIFMSSWGVWKYWSSRSFESDFVLVLFNYLIQPTRPQISIDLKYSSSKNSYSLNCYVCDADSWREQKRKPLMIMVCFIALAIFCPYGYFRRWSASVRWPTFQ